MEQHSWLVATPLFAVAALRLPAAGLGRRLD